MTENEALHALSELVALTTGWNDDSAEMYTIEVAKWPDADAGLAACRAIAQSWTDRSRPPFGVLRNAYRTEVARRAAEQVALPEPEQGRSGGLEAAKKAYEDEYGKPWPGVHVGADEVNTA